MVQSLMEDTHDLVDSGSEVAISDTRGISLEFALLICWKNL